MSRPSLAVVAASLLCMALAASALTEQCGIYPDIKPWVRMVNQVQFNGDVDWPSACGLYGTVYCPTSAFSLTTKNWNAHPVFMGGKGGLAMLTYDNQPYLQPGQVDNTTVTWDPCTGNTVNLWGGSLTFPVLCGDDFATAHPAGPYPTPMLNIAFSQTVCANQSASGWPVKSVAFWELKTFDAAEMPVVSMRFRFGYYAY